MLQHDLFSRFHFSQIGRNKIYLASFLRHICYAFDFILVLAFENLCQILPSAIFFYRVKTAIGTIMLDKTQRWVKTEDKRIAQTNWLILGFHSKLMMFSCNLYTRENRIKSCVPQFFYLILIVFQSINIINGNWNHCRQSKH